MGISDLVLATRAITLYRTLGLRSCVPITWSYSPCKQNDSPTITIHRTIGNARMKIAAGLGTALPQPGWVQPFSIWLYKALPHLAGYSPSASSCIRPFRIRLGTALPHPAVYGLSASGCIRPFRIRLYTALSHPAGYSPSTSCYTATVGSRNNNTISNNKMTRIQRIQ